MRRSAAAAVVVGLVLMMSLLVLTTLTPAGTAAATTGSPTRRPTTKAPTRRPTTKSPTRRPTTRSPTLPPITVPFRFTRMTLGSAEIGAFYWESAGGAQLTGGGATPTQWVMENATAASIPVDLDSLRSFLVNKGTCAATCNVEAYVEQTQGTFRAGLPVTTNAVFAAFRVVNTKTTPVQWTIKLTYTASSNAYYSYYRLASRASVSLNGEDTWSASVSGTASVTLVLPPNRVSTLIVASTSGEAMPLLSTYRNREGVGELFLSVGRSLRLAFLDDSLRLPSGLAYVDDWDTPLAAGANPKFRYGFVELGDDNGWALGDDPTPFAGVLPSTYSDSLDPMAPILSNLSVTSMSRLRSIMRSSGSCGTSCFVHATYTCSRLSSSKPGVLLFGFRIHNAHPFPLKLDPARAYTSMPGPAQVTSIAIDGVAQDPSFWVLPPKKTSTLLLVIYDYVLGTSLFNFREVVAGLAFTDNSLVLPTGVTFVDDWDTLDNQTLAFHRWRTFDTHDESVGWFFDNDARLFGGVTPQQWTDGNATAAALSTDLDVLRRFLFRTATCGPSCVVATRFGPNPVSNMTGRMTVAAFRVRNANAVATKWTVSWGFTANATKMGEMASVAVNGVNVATYETSGTANVTLTLPARTTSTVVFVSGSGDVIIANYPGQPDSPEWTMWWHRNHRLAFLNDTLALPKGLSYVVW